MEAKVGIQVQGSDVIFSMLLDSAEAGKAGERATTWYDTVVKPKLAALAERPAYKNVVGLAARRGACEAEIASRERAIEQVRQSLCSGDALRDEGAVDRAVTEISNHEDAIRRLRLTVESIDAVLPEAERTRQHDAAAAMRELHDTLLEEVQKQQATKARTVVQRVGSGGVEWLELQEKIQRLNQVKEGAMHTAVGVIESMVAETSEANAG